MLSRTQLHALRNADLNGRPNRILLARELADVTQVEVQSATGIPQTHISRLERGNYRSVTLETVRPLATYFGCAIEDLFPQPHPLARPRKRAIA